MIDQIRQKYLALAERIDSFRIIPRVLVAAYALLVYLVVSWYMALEPYLLEGYNSTVIRDCIIQAPTTQHTALVTAVVGAAAVVIGLYTTTGRKWNGFTPWNQKNDEIK